MIFKNIKPILEIDVSCPSPYHMIVKRHSQRVIQDPHPPHFERHWFDWPTSDAWRRQSDTSIEGFKAVVVGYRFNLQAKCGLDRRDALRMLNRCGLRPLTHKETFLLASEEIWLESFREVIRSSGDRPICSPVSINKEFPFFYSFGFFGVKGREEFKVTNYNQAGSRLFFGYYRIHGFLDTKTAMPFIVGVNDESLNTNITPAKKALAMGKTLCEDISCHRCKEKGAICLYTPGGHAMIMQCIHCDKMFKIDGE